MTFRPLLRIAVVGVAVAGAAMATGVGAGAAVSPSNAAAAGAATVATSRTQPVGSPLTLPLGAPTGGPAALVDPLDGTGVGAANPGNVSEYPGASVPLGMVQFSPDTSPHRSLTTGSGYDYADSLISGFSLTHLSGDGCAIYGDIPILPVTGAVPLDPNDTVQPFTHASERATAGNYGVTVGGANGGIEVALTATTRSALGSFVFPGTGGGGGGGSSVGGGASSDDLLFKVSDSANGSSASQVRVVGTDELAGSVTSGDFCGIPGNYTLYFTAQFSQKFAAGGTWQNSAPGFSPSCAGTASVTCGAWVSFAPAGGGAGSAAAGAPAGRTKRVLVKVGVSFVSADGATANLQAEERGWNFRKVSRAATSEWNGLLGRVAVGGGSGTNRRTFYTALYHSLLFPSVFSDDDGGYMGFDHRVHTLPKGQVQYSNISEADIYRSEVPLLATLLPGPTSMMVQSLLRDAAQTKGGYLPKWVIGSTDAGEWDGDSADPIIADAYAFGARSFNVRRALAAMIHGATVPGSGFIVERPNLAEYTGPGWVPELTYDVTSYPYTDGGSETLEYSLDDFAISQLAAASGDTAAAATFAKRSQNWQNLFDPATGYLAARTADGSFPAGAAFQAANLFDQLEGIAQPGWEEGNAVQYTWAVPQNLAGLFGFMGGDRAAAAKLTTFLSQLDATRFRPFDWAGNEPDESVPYDFDYAGEPWATQSVVRRIESQLYAAAPVDEPGEDDLGALSSWYVWSALGLYPETPGVASLAITSPLFPRATITEGNGHTITVAVAVTGHGAPDVYIEKAELAIGSGGATFWNKPWIPARALSDGASLSLDLRRVPDKHWGTAASAAPPSFSQGAAPAVGFTTPGGALTVPADGSATFRLGAQEESANGSARTVTWEVVPPVGVLGVRVSPASGTFKVVGGRGSIPLVVSSGSPGTFAVTFKLAQGGRSLPSLTLDVVVASPS